MRGRDREEDRDRDGERGGWYTKRGEREKVMVRKINLNLRGEEKDM